MFTEFTPITGSLFNQRVNGFLGSLFLGTVALWAAMLIWNATQGSNPIERALANAVQSSTFDQ